MHSLCYFILFLTLLYCIKADDEFQRKKTHIKKDVRDYTDRDIDSLYDEWEVRFCI
jgi:hypothetical protein